VLLAFLPVRAAGQEPVTLERVIHLARQRAPSIAAARGRVVQAEGRRFASSVPPDPEVTLGYARGKPSEGGPSADENSVEVTQFLPSPRGVRARLRAGTFGVEAAERDVEATTADAVLEAKRFFYEAAVGEAEARALGEAAEDASSFHDIMERRVQLGEGTEADRLRTRIEALRAQLEARAAGARAEAQRAALNRFLLGALGETFSVSGDLDPTRLIPVAGDLVALATSRNPEYRAALLRVEQAGSTLTAERALRLPGLAASFFREKELDKTASGFSLGIAVPLWNRNQGGVRIAEGELREAEAEALDLKARIEAEVERLARADQSARELAISYRREILPAAAEVLSIIRFSLEQGEANLLSWLEARRSYLEILRTSYQAQLEAFLRRAELVRLVGGFDEIGNR
jgi:cobalt-zinc-cadmium efflux system outer membrane protein